MKKNVNPSDHYQRLGQYFAIIPEAQPPSAAKDNDFGHSALFLKKKDCAPDGTVFPFYEKDNFKYKDDPTLPLGPLMPAFLLHEISFVQSGFSVSARCLQSLY